MYRFDIINRLIQRYGYQRYLEIGVERGETFNNVQCAVKHGVDPFSDNATFRIPSNEFFAMIHDDVEYALFLSMVFMWKTRHSVILKTRSCI